jgi:hypothetical protein
LTHPAGADLQSVPLLQTILFDIDDVFSALMAEVRITNPHQHGIYEKKTPFVLMF